MRKFEYKKLPYFKMADNLIEILNELGADGWELVAITGGKVIFKREL